MMDASFFLCALDCIVKIDSRRLNENPSAFYLKCRGVSSNK